MDSIDKDKWQQALQQLNWYELIADDFTKLELTAQKEPDYKKRKAIKNQAYQIVEDALTSDIIFLGAEGPDFDTERKPIDTVVIHHTSNPPGMSLNRLNTIQLIRIYGRYYNNPVSPKERDLKGKPIWSGHFYQGKQVFWGYHWLIRENGETIRLLDDDKIGWHAGNWDINCRSIGICFDDDLIKKEPSIDALKSARRVVSKYKNSKIIGHKDANPNTDCPGEPFYSTWEQKLF